MGRISDPNPNDLQEKLLDEWEESTSPLGGVKPQRPTHVSAFPSDHSRPASVLRFGTKPFLVEKRTE